MKLGVFFSTLMIGILPLAALRAAPLKGEPEPELKIPFCAKAPTIDGKLDDPAWKSAARIEMLETYPSYAPRVMRAEPVDFYVMWDAENLYIAMESKESNTDSIIASGPGGDCVELMIFPASTKELKRADIPVYYMLLNTTGIAWDSKLFPLYNEEHDSWDSKAAVANTVDGEKWIVETKIPFRSLVKEAPGGGETWRMNFVRTYYGYRYAGWNARGALNDANVGGEVRFSSDSAVARIISNRALSEGKLGLTVEAVNPSNEKKTVKWELEAYSVDGVKNELIGKDSKTLTLEPGQTKEIQLGASESLKPSNKVTVKATDEKGAVLLGIYERQVRGEPLRLQKVARPKVSLVLCRQVFYPSKEKLAITVDYSAWQKKQNKEVSANTTISIRQKGVEKPLVSEDIKGGKKWEMSTEKLPEGEYESLIKISSADGELISEYSDWFVKRNFPWMKKRAGTEDVLAPLFEGMSAKGRSIKLWGRTYVFGENGLPEKIVSQDKTLNLAPFEIVAEANGTALQVTVKKPFAFTKTSPTKIEGISELQVGPLPVTLHMSAEYDGFILYGMSYGEENGNGKIDRFRIKVLLDMRNIKFYSASGDPQGTSVFADAFPSKEGLVFDSINSTRSVTLTPSFATLFWTADYETCFCYAADNDKGWIIREDSPAVEAWRKGDELTLWLNLIDRPATITKKQTLEFAFQAGPVKPMPKGWRGWQDMVYQTSGDPGMGTLNMVQDGAGDDGMDGGACFMGPGEDKAALEKNIARLAKRTEGGNKIIVGYHYWGTAPKGQEATRVFRGEWGISKEQWDAAKEKVCWNTKRFGENEDLYTYVKFSPTPSYVDFLSEYWRRALESYPMSEGFYDDVGYPKPGFDQALNVPSSGIWLYRERWKRAAVLTGLAGKRNLTRDSQHVIAHYMPAYNFIGVWAPCERGYYNPFEDRDNYEYYGSLERYYAYNPHMAFGQPAMVGMGSPQEQADLLRRDTRTMMLLVYLHDQEVGCFGRRDMNTSARFRHARNQFRPWEDGVSFTGWWKSKDLVAAAPAPDMVVSFYSRPKEAMFVIGNRGDKSAPATITPNWEKLGLDKDCEVFDAMTLARCEVKNGVFQVDVPRHECRLVIAAPKGQYPEQPEVPGSKLPLPKKLVTEFCDKFDGAELSKAWTVDKHPGTSCVFLEDKRLCIQGDPAGFCHLRRPFDQDNFSVQCQIVHGLSAGLILSWPDNSYVQAGFAEKFFSIADGKKKSGSASSTVLKEDYPFRRDWVKIQLTPEEIVFFSSIDGSIWKKEGTFPRSEMYKGAPSFLMLGFGQPGENPHLDNVNPKVFKEGGVKPYVFFDDLIVGREK